MCIFVDIHADSSAVAYESLWKLSFSQYQYAAISLLKVSQVVLIVVQMLTYILYPHVTSAAVEPDSGLLSLKYRGRITQQGSRTHYFLLPL